MLIIVILLIRQFSSTSCSSLPPKSNPSGLLSPRIYSGLLEPRSYLIVNFKPLKEELSQYIAQNNLTAGIYVENFRNGAYMGINEKREFFPASLAKLPIAIAIMQNVEDGNLEMEKMIDLRGLQGSDGFGYPYNLESSQLSVRTLLEKMLKESDNSALEALYFQLTRVDIQRALDYYGIDINTENFSASHFITPKAMSILFSSLYFSTVLEAKDSEYLLSTLEDTVLDIKKLSGIPPNIRVIHKFGLNYYQNSRFFHDCGLIYIDDSRIFYCVMTQDLEKEEAVKHISTIVHSIYGYVMDTKQKLEQYKK